MDTYSEYIMWKTNELVKVCGGIRAASRTYGVAPAVISKVASGKYVPKPETFARWFNEDTNNLKRMKESDRDHELAELDVLIDNAVKKRNEMTKNAEKRKLIKEVTALCEKLNYTLDKLNYTLDKLNKFEEL